MGELEIKVDQIRQLVRLVEQNNLEELTVEEGDLSVTVKGRSAAGQPPVIAHAAPGHAEAAAPVAVEHEQAAEPEVEAEENPLEAEGNVVDIVAPLVGVFYRSPAPDAPAFIEVGDEIEVGTEIGLIEAMKVFSPIPSEVAGTVVAIPGVNGKLVHEGDVLVRVRIRE